MYLLGKTIVDSYIAVRYMRLIYRARALYVPKVNLPYLASGHLLFLKNLSNLLIKSFLE